MIAEVLHQNWHLQGFTSDPESKDLFWSFTDSVVKTNQNSTVLCQVHVSGGHLGDIDFHNGKLYASFLGQPLGGHVWDDWTSYKIYVFDAADLRLEKIIDLPVCDRLRAEADTGKDPYGFHAIDGVTFAPVGGEDKMFVACATLSGETYFNQLTLQFSEQGEFEKLHTIPTGNTVFGIQNLDHDDTTGCFWITTYGSSEPYQAKETLFCIAPDLKTVVAKYAYSTPYGFECLGNGQFLASVQAGVNGAREGYAYSCTEQTFTSKANEKEITERILRKGANA